MKEFNESRHKFSKSKMNEVRRNLYETENKKNLSVSKVKKIEKNLLKLQKSLSKQKRFYDYDDAEYKETAGVKYLFHLSIDEDYYKPIITNNAFNKNYIQYESKGNKYKILAVTEYLDIIRPYLSDITNHHKTQSEWKIQLTIEINFISSKPDSDKARTMHTKSNNV